MGIPVRPEVGVVASRTAWVAVIQGVGLAVCVDRFVCIGVQVAVVGGLSIAVGAKTEVFVGASVGVALGVTVAAGGGEHSSVNKILAVGVPDWEHAARQPKNRPQATTALAVDIAAVLI